eukprot:scaffold3327_cov52-Attheya_sp.AAC.3
MVYGHSQSDRVRRWLEPFPPLEYEDYFSIRIMAHLYRTIPVIAVTNKSHLKCQCQNGHANLCVKLMLSLSAASIGKVFAMLPTIQAT